MVVSVHWPSSALLYYPWDLGAKQPISFSHRVHAGTKEIGCLMCHPGALTRAGGGDSARAKRACCATAGSSFIIPRSSRSAGMTSKGEPIWWVRVTNLPDLAHFDHSMHLAAGVDCGKCHGDVKAMDRIVLHQNFTMGFCIQCHRENNATQDCFACHY